MGTKKGVLGHFFGVLVVLAGIVAPGTLAADPCSEPFWLFPPAVEVTSLAEAANIPAFPETPTLTPRSADADVT